MTKNNNCASCLKDTPAPKYRNTPAGFICNDCTIANCNHKWVAGHETLVAPYEFDARFCVECFHLEKPGFNKYHQKLKKDL